MPCEQCARLEKQIVALKLSLKRLREQYDRMYTKAQLAGKYKRERDDAREEVEDWKQRCAVTISGSVPLIVKESAK